MICNLVVAVCSTHYWSFILSKKFYKCFICQVMEMFRGCRREDMPPHIFAAAQQAYHSMLSSRSDQSLILMGVSGSGKTFNTRFLLKYLGSFANGTSTITCK